MGSFLYGAINAATLKSGRNWKEATSKRRTALSCGTSRIILRRDFVYPNTFALRHASGWLIGYTNSNTYRQIVHLLQSYSKIETITNQLSVDVSAEFFLINIDILTGKLSFLRDALCTVPIFYGQNRDSIVFGNDFSEIAEKLTRGTTTIRLDIEGLVCSIATIEHEDKTFLDGMHLLTERASLTWNGKVIRLHLPSPSPLPRPRRSKKTLLQFESILENTFSRYRVKIPSNVKVALELSGGVDSATVAGLWRRRVRAYTMMLPEGHSLWQKRKIELLGKRFSLRLRPITIGDRYVFSDYALSWKKKLRYPFQEIYSAALSKQVAIMAREKMRVVLTGMGGDELFIIDEYEKSRQYVSPPLPAFFLRRTKLVASRMGRKTNFPNPIVPYSVLGANTARNNLYIKKGIWPVAVLADPALVVFCRTLPEKIRVRKKTLRDYLSKHGYPSEVWQESKNENFGRFFIESLRGPSSGFLLKLFEGQMILEHLGFINARKLRTAFQSFVTGDDTLNPMYFYAIAVMEMNLRVFKCRL